MRNVFSIDDLPYIEFGNEIKRKVRLVISPYTNVDNNVNIVHVSIPPSSILEN